MMTLSWIKLGRIAVFVIPAVTMIVTHVNWESSRASQLRMLTKQVGFWGGMAIGMTIVHLKQLRQMNPWFSVPIFAVSAVLPIVGYQGGIKLAPKLFPKVSSVQPSIEPLQPVLPLTYTSKPTYRAQASLYGKMASLQI